MLRSLLFGTLAAATLSLAVSAQTCTVTPYGSGCGPVLTGSSVPNGQTARVTFTISQAKPHTAVVTMYGANALALNLFNTGCLLLVEPVFTQVHQTDASGTYSFSRALPNGTTGATRIQFAEVEINGSSFTVRTTNGVILDCK